MINELISIIVPVYNAEKNLKRCVDSILNQSYVNLEIVLVDDGSSDNSYNICKEYKKKDKRVVLLHQKNCGVSSARNRGLEVAKGKYIGFVDSDDYIENKMYELLIKNLVESNSKISSCNYFYESETGYLIKNYNSPNIVFLSDFLPEYMFNNLCINGFLCNKLYDRDLIFNKHKLTIMNENIKIMEDNLFNYELFDNNEGFMCSYINDKLYHYVQYSSSACNNKYNMSNLQYFWVREKQIQILEKNDKNCDFLKADYVINFTKTKIKYKLLKILKDEYFFNIKNKSDEYKKAIRILNLNNRTRIKFIISRWFSIAYWIYILINKENI